MTSTNLDAEIFYQLSLLAGNRFSLEKVLSFLKELTKTSDQVSTQKERLLNMLSDYQEYELNWDGDGALPLERKSIKNFKDLLKGCPDNLLAGWDLEPDANGTLLLVSDNSTVNIGNSGFSYFIKDNGKLKGDNSDKFSVPAIIDVLKEAGR